MNPIRPVRRWMHAFAALLLLALGPGIAPSRAEGAALSQSFVADLGKATALKRELGGTRSATLPAPFDDDGGPDAATLHAAQSTGHWVPAVDLSKTDSTAPPSPRFCGASARAPPSA
jgi:hypothetical protein